MRFRLLTAIATGALALVLSNTPVAHAGPDPDPVQPNIIGGDTVSSAPWAAQIYSNGGFTCSGSIIGARYVLTAADCLNGTMTVRVGSVTLGSGTQAGVSARSTRYDLAILTLDRSISTTYMGLGSTNPPTGATNNIYGWGMTCRYFCGTSRTLKTATVRVTGMSTDGMGGPAIASTRINGNAWRGDSGGPQLYNGLQVGVASTADGRANQYYGSVPSNRDWIRSVTGI